MTSQQQQQHQHQHYWHPEDIDDALVADFDGSLSGLCIMSLSFDFTRNSTAVAAAAAAAAVATTTSTGTHLQSQLQPAILAAGGPSSQASHATQDMSPAHSQPDRDHTIESSFKRFKADTGEPQLMQQENNSSKIVRQLQKLKSCLNAAAASNPLAAHLSAITQATGGGGASPAPSEVAEPFEVEEEDEEPLSESSRCSSTVDAHTPRSPSPSSSLSSPSTCSTGPSRQQSPAPHQDDSEESSADDQHHDKCRRSSMPPNDVASHLNGSKTKTTSAAATPTTSASSATAPPAGSSLTSAEKQLSVYSVKDSLMNNQGSTLKESSYTTSVITTSAPMPHTFKSIHHPFHSFKQFPLSPYQFSNSSLNHHDLYDRYLSQHDSHQPLQTPLIGIERTQDLLSLKLPPHGPEESDSTAGHRVFGGSTKPDWMFMAEQPDTPAPSSAKEAEQSDAARKTVEDPIFPHFAYSKNNKQSTGQREPIDLNVNYHLTAETALSHGDFVANKRLSSSDSLKSQLFSQTSSKSGSMHRVSPAAVQPEEEQHRDEEQEDQERDNTSQMAPESMFGVEAGKQKFQYVLAAPISVATKLSEDTMTYLNQSQAYEIKLENLTDVAEAKKGFMCSIINIGFQERHMQQAENELWQQWSQQHPNEKIFSVDMKLSYNVFGVESDGLNKYEFLWDSSKIAGVFIRINSISTEFTPKKHGGEKGVPFKLSIETFSYNSKTHDSYFISAACCQIKVFKPKGAERKIRSDRDKISRRPLQEQDKYHGPCEHSLFHECSLASLHPMADGSLCYYRHSHGHFASKQVISAASSNTSGGPNNSTHSQLHTQAAANQASDDELDSSPNHNNKHSANSSPGQQCNSVLHNNRRPTTGEGVLPVEHRTDFHDLTRSCISTTANKSYPHLSYPASRLIHPQNHYSPRDTTAHPSDYSTAAPYGVGTGPAQQANMDSSGSSFNSFVELAPLQQPNPFSHHHHHHHQHHPMYNTNQVARTHHHHHLPAINSHASHFNVAYHYGHPPAPVAQPAHHLSSSSSAVANSASNLYDTTPSIPNTFTTIAHASNHFPIHQHVPTTKGSLYHRNPHNDTNKVPPLQPTSGSSPSLSSSFRASNLALSSHSQSNGYNPVTFAIDTAPTHHHPSEGPPYSFVHSYHQHQLTATSTPDATTTHELLPASGPQKQQPRTVSSEPYYSSSNISNARHHSDGYLSSGGGSLPDTATTPSSAGGSITALTSGPASALHWMHGSPVHHHHSSALNHLAPGGGSNPSVFGGGPTTLRATALSHNDSHIYNNNTSATTNNNQFNDCNTNQNQNNNNNNNNNYDSDHNSPQHENQHTSDSSSSCQSRFKNNSSLILPANFNNSQQDSSRMLPTQQTTNNLQITANSNCTEVKSWLAANRFSLFVKTFSNFSGSDLLRLSKTDLIEICGIIDGIRLFNSLHISQPIKHIFCDQNMSLDYHHA